MGPCNTAIFTEAIGSLVHSLRRHLLIHQPQIRTEVIDDEDEFNLTRWEVPLKGLGLHRRKETLKINALGRIGCFLGNSREHPSIEFLRSLQMAHLDAVKHRLADKYGDRVWRIWLSDRKHNIHVIFSDDNGKTKIELEMLLSYFEIHLKGLSSEHLIELFVEARQSILLSSKMHH